MVVKGAYTFIHTSSIADAAEAKDALEGAEVGGKKVVLGFAKEMGLSRRPGCVPRLFVTPHPAPLSPSSLPAAPPPKTPTRNLHVSGYPPETTAEDLRDLFAKCVCARRRVALSLSRRPPLHPSLPHRHCEVLGVRLKPGYVERGEARYYHCTTPAAVRLSDPARHDDWRPARTALLLLLLLYFFYCCHCYCYYCYYCYYCSLLLLLLPLLTPPPHLAGTRSSTRPRSPTPSTSATSSRWRTPTATPRR